MGDSLIQTQSKPENDGNISKKSSNFKSILKATSYYSHLDSGNEQINENFAPNFKNLSAQRSF